MRKPIPYNKVKIVDRDTVKFGDPVFDAFISEKGGIELATMIALSGTSGAGKTTLCKKWQKDLSEDEVSVFYALESLKSSVARQTSRIKTSNTELICDEEDFPKWSEFMDYLYEDEPTMVIIDSLQHAATLLSKDNGKHKYQNYKEIIKDLYTWKDKTQGIVILICQLNAEGKMEGPASTIFDVDCPIKLTADPKTGERYMTTEKNRMGPIGKLFYEFVNTEACIKFYTVEQWEVERKGVDLEEMINSTIEKFLNAYSTHKNYEKFRAEFAPLYRRIYGSTNDPHTITCKTIALIQGLSKKYFR